MFNFTDFIIIELTFDCNLKCSYCYLKYDKYRHNKEKMSFETFKDVIDNLIEKKIQNNNRLETQIVLHGGEPTLVGSEVLEKMIDYAKQKFDENNFDYNLTIQTNAVAIDESFVSGFKKLNNVGISFDGVDEAFNMRTTNDNLKEKVKNSINILKKHNIPYGFVSVVSKKNIDNLNLYDTEFFTNAKLIPIYDTKDGSENLKPGEFFEKVIKKDLENLSYINGSMSASTLDRVFKRVFVDLMFEHSNSCQSTCNFRFCGAGIRIMAVQPNGEVHRCDRWTLNDDTKKYINFGHHNTFDFLGINQLRSAVSWNQMLNTVNKEGGCDTCYANYACESDCQALHYSRYGDFGIDKRMCKQIKSLYDYAEKNIVKIINNFIDYDKYFIFEEDQVYNLRMRKDVILRNNNIYYEKKQGDNLETYIKFGRIDD